MKKLFKILGISLGIILLLLLLTPFLFKGTFEDLLKKNINKNLNAEVTWKSMDISLFKSFPKAAVVIENFTVINRAPFKGDTLASGEQLKINMGITQLFKSGNDPIAVDGLQLDKGLINIKIDSLARANYDIAIKDDTNFEAEHTSTEETGFVFDLKRYEINNTRLNYTDDVSKTYLFVSNLHHEGTGDFSLETSNLETQTNALVSLRLGDIDYLNKNSISLDANFQLDLENQKYTFLENEAKINELPLTFNGFVQINETNNEVDLTFKTPSSDFKNFLAVIPKTYVKELDGVETTGNFSIDGALKGIVDEERIPTMDIKVRSSNASFKYPDLPKTVRNITINADLKNETGLVKDTYLTIGNLTFRIDEELFAANGSIRNLTENALVNLAIKGTLNLEHIDQVLPIELEQPLRGIFTADVTTNFDMASVENEQYQNIKTNGTARLQDFTYSDAAFKNPINIGNAAVTMSPGNIQLNEMTASTGGSDINATGNIQNLIPWIMAKQDLKGVFNIQSNTFNLNDFTSEESTETASGATKSTNSSIKESRIQVPDFLDATLNFTANKIIYDDLILDNAKGSVAIKNETASLSNVTSSLLGGDIAVSGNVSTKGTTPTFAMDLDLKSIDIGSSFQQLKIMSFLAPIAKALEGDINTRIKLNGNLNNDLTPNISTLAGDALAQIITAEVDKSKTPLLSKLGEQVKFLNIDKLSLRDVSTVLKFNNGKIEVQPFTFDVKGIDVTIAGSHGLDKSISYNLNMDVPAKYLGGDVQKLLAKLDPADAENTTVALPIGVRGNITNPQITVDTKAAVTTLTKKLIDKQKEDIKDQGVNIIKDLIGGGSTPKDSTSTGQGSQPSTTEVVKDIFGGLFGKKKKDSIN
ncbi:AsmA-like C-terminal region-containing protein [Rasiella rasia]|uniref:AsmA-like C-terminal region-containing protein n=1 Tax=Rasiella rasia TaxID=2744027 RepID=A0A6G6GNN7_9FLAO|nr:AsmA-like C-terminal region-containing protein [Rasiella rasia]QIE60195.1 AsmA-like C-terminal region-containing protein [Rasiella rasia]